MCFLLLAIVAVTGYYFVKYRNIYLYVKKLKEKRDFCMAKTYNFDELDIKNMLDDMLYIISYKMGENSFGIDTFIVFTELSKEPNKLLKLMPQIYGYGLGDEHIKLNRNVNIFDDILGSGIHSFTGTYEEVYAEILKKFGFHYYQLDATQCKTKMTIKIKKCTGNTLYLGIHKRKGNKYVECNTISGSSESIINFNFDSVIEKTNPELNHYGSILFVFEILLITFLCIYILQ